MEGVLSKGVLSGNGVCLEGVMYGGGFVRGVFVRRGFCPRTPFYTIIASQVDLGSPFNTCITIHQAALSC